MRFEATTFTCATYKPTAAKSRSDNDLTNGDDTARSAYATRQTLPASQSFISEQESDPGLAFIVEAWSDLPDAVRAGIVAMVRAAHREQLVKDE